MAPHSELLRVVDTDTAIAFEPVSTDPVAHTEPVAPALRSTSEVLRQVDERLAHATDLSEFYGHVLSGAVASMHAEDGAVFLLEDGDRLRLAATVVEGVLRDCAERDPDGGGTGHSLRACSDWPALVAARGAPRAYDAAGFGGIVAGSPPWRGSREHRRVVVAALLLGEEPVGLLVVASPDPRDPSPEQLECLATLGRQAALTVHAIRLADEARDSAVLAERTRIAGEIHDSLAQAFAGISIHLEAAHEVLRRAGASVTHDGLDSTQFVERAKDLARFGLAEARRSVLTLRPHALDGFDLRDGLRRLCGHSTVPGRVTCEFRATGTPAALDPRVQAELFRVAQEAIANALKHARARRIEVWLRNADGIVELGIADDGVGLPDVVRRAGVAGGYGLAGMRERCERLHGRFDLGATPGGGTTVTVRVSSGR